MFQQTLIIGNLGHDPELRYTREGTPVASFSVATTERWKDHSGEPQEKTTWFRVVAWSKLGELCHQYLAKGRKVMVVGTVDASAYDGKDGKPKASLELRAQTVKFLDSGNREETDERFDERPRAAASRPANGNGRQAPPPIFEDEEEVPF